MRWFFRIERSHAGRFRDRCAIVPHAHLLDNWRFGGRRSSCFYQ